MDVRKTLDASKPCKQLLRFSYVISATLDRSLAGVSEPRVDVGVGTNKMGFGAYGPGGVQVP
jgi:hypothetical protein